jgi:2-polyprenyl-3-methyl-5-hydroxy-6-metoxy-1,4-benzoquinol methylase
VSQPTTYPYQVSWATEARTAQLILELRELLIRADENEKAAALMHCVPWYCLHRGDLQQAYRDTMACTEHLRSDEAYEAYYSANPNEQPFEQQFGIEVAQAVAAIPRVGFLHGWLVASQEGRDERLRVLDLACNDGWMAQALADVAVVDGFDLGEGCIDRAKARGLDGRFFRGRAETAFKVTSATYDAVVAFELIEHVPDPRALLDAMVKLCAPDGRLFVSTPMGTDHGGDLPGWDVVEPKGHVRVYIPETFHAALAEHGEVEEITLGGDSVMVARVKP